MYQKCIRIVAEIRQSMIVTELCNFIALRRKIRAWWSKIVALAWLLQGALGARRAEYSCFVPVWLGSAGQG